MDKEKITEKIINDDTREIMTNCGQKTDPEQL